MFTCSKSSMSLVCLSIHPSWFYPLAGHRMTFNVSLFNGHCAIFFQKYPGKLEWNHQVYISRVSQRILSYPIALFWGFHNILSSTRGVWSHPVKYNWGGGRGWPGYCESISMTCPPLPPPGPQESSMMETTFPNSCHMRHRNQWCATIV